MDHQLGAPSLQIKSAEKIAASLQLAFCLIWFKVTMSYFLLPSIFLLNPLLPAKGQITLTKPCIPHFGLYETY